MNFIYCTLLFFSSFLFTHSQGQADENVFQSGTVQTKEGSFQGDLKVDLESNSLILRQDNQYKHLSAKMIQSAAIGDSRFMGLEFDGAYYLFEVLYSGTQTLVYRENLMYKYTDAPEELLPFFFVVEGRLIPVSKPKELLDAFGADEKWMSVYVKSNRLDLTAKDDLQVALEYYAQQKL